jgi:hypothetical protein
LEILLAKEFIFSPNEKLHQLHIGNFSVDSNHLFLFSFFLEKKGVMKWYVSGNTFDLICFFGRKRIYLQWHTAFLWMGMEMKSAYRC